jgi:hypothetical protein
MLARQTIARIKEILRGHQCPCGKPAERFQSNGNRFHYLCQQCYMTNAQEPHRLQKPNAHYRGGSGYKVYKVHCEIPDKTDSDNVFELCWVPPRQPRKIWKSRRCGA